MTVVTSFSWLAQRKSCYGIVDPRHGCKIPSLSLPLRLHLPSLSVLLLLPPLPCIGRVSHRLHFQVSSIVSPYMRGFSQHAVPLDLGVITNHILRIGHLACIPISSCFSKGYNLTLSWA
ncbi:serine-rich and transmembrane domain-containing protein 1 isoform X1 [Harpia harpyja]|uniref:serine-rich and transmembrane domain-containing protein 1 isoform X1 n=1 Tax=Harpia harpyja TaxID=202280 RepID=UPI0022B1E5D8|nr:serine-rich and transmembrane domain-containing protein 1 isoform X1 [Harpia harpyja]